MGRNALVDGTGPTDIGRDRRTGLALEPRMDLDAVRVHREDATTGPIDLAPVAYPTLVTDGV